MARALGKCGGTTSDIIDALAWVTGASGVPGAGQSDTLDLLPPVRRAIDMLHGAGLVSPIRLAREPRWQITPLGQLTLAEGTVRQRLTGVSSR